MSAKADTRDSVRCMVHPDLTQLLNSVLNFAHKMLKESRGPEARKSATFVSGPWYGLTDATSKWLRLRLTEGQDRTAPQRSYRIAYYIP